MLRSVAWRGAASLGQGQGKLAIAPVRGAFSSVEEVQASPVATPPTSDLLSHDDLQQAIGKHNTLQK